MGKINLQTEKTISQPGKSPAKLRRTRTGQKRSLIALICICFLWFIPYSQQTNTSQSMQFITDPEDMEQYGYYYFADHGSGMSVVQYDRMEESSIDGNDIYTFYSIKPLLLSFSGSGLWGTVGQAGSIRVATSLEIVHLLLCIAAGTYIPL